MKMTRRRMLSTLAVGSAGLVSGCCSTSPAIKYAERQSGSGLLDWDESHPSHSIGKQRIVDAHAHFFNATDMQAGGYLGGPIARSMPKWKPLLEILAPRIDGLARIIAPSTSAEWLKLTNLETETQPKSLRERKQEIRNDIRDQNELIAEELYNRLSRTAFPETYQRLLGELGFSVRDKRPFSKKLILESIDLKQSSRKAVHNDLNANGIASDEHPDGLLAFIGNMLGYRYSNIFKHQLAYLFDSEKTITTHACGALVDFDRWVGDCDEAYSSMRDQILLHQRLAELSGCYVQPLVAYNPWTAIVQGDKYLDMIEDAIKYRGFVGVKIYPPIGYFPTGNSTPGTYPDRSSKPDLQKLDDKLFKLYDLCIDCDVAVMAHGNHSMGAEAHHEKMAGPAAWASLLINEKYKNLKVNIGHFGGFHRVESDPGHNWSKEFIQLMTTAKNLYADTGNWETLIASNSPAYEELVGLFNQPLLDGKKASSRIMYGTDWFMLSKANKWYQYADSNYSNLVDKVDDQVLNSYLYENAVSLFNIKRVNTIPEYTLA